jgi:hypothetical protein
MKISANILIPVLLMLPAGTLAQISIPAGTILPAQLNTSVDSQKLKVGNKLTARIMQDVPGTQVRVGAKLIGEIIKVEVPKGQPAQITLRFDNIKVGHQAVPVKTSLRALASMMEIEDAQTPTVGTDRGTPWAWMPRTLIGGEAAYGQGGPVVHGADVVGTAVFDGVLAPAQKNPHRGCRGEVEGNSKPQALWVFASDACGVYGMENIRIAQNGRTSPLGEITLSSSEGRLLVHSGSGILLRVNPNSQ